MIHVISITEANQNFIKVAKNARKYGDTVIFKRIKPVYVLFDIEVHKRIIATSGGKDGTKDIALLDSVVSSIYQTYDSKELYLTLIEKAARLCFAINKNHLFIDGNI
jgi:prophage maintenance system killer protein